MVLKPEPIFEAVEATEHTHGTFHKVLLCPRGARYTQEKARELAAEDQLLFLCGRYEGFDGMRRNSRPSIIEASDDMGTLGKIARACLEKLTV